MGLAYSKVVHFFLSLVNSSLIHSHTLRKFITNRTTLKKLILNCTYGKKNAGLPLNHGRLLKVVHLQSDRSTTIDPYDAVTSSIRPQT